VSVITNDGNNFVGTLKGIDQKTNLVLEDCEERQFSLTSEVQIHALGLFLIKGDSVALLGAVDIELEQAFDLKAARAARIKPIRH